MFARIRQPGLVLIALVLAMAGTACALHEDLDQYPFRVSFSELDTGGTDADMAVDFELPDDGIPDLDPQDMDMDIDPQDMDMDIDMVDMVPDMEVFGMVCPDVDTEPIIGVCDPVNQTGCPDDFPACGVTLYTLEPIAFQRRCLAVTGRCTMPDPDGDMGADADVGTCEGGDTGEEGQECTNDSECPSIWVQEVGESCGSGRNRCVEGSHCVGGSNGVCRKYCELATARGCEPDEYCTPITADTAEIGVCADSC